MINEFRGNEEAIFEVPEGSSITPVEIYAEFLEAFGFGDVNDGWEITKGVLWFLVGNLVFVRLLCLLFLKFITFERR